MFELAMGANFYIPVAYMHCALSSGIGIPVIMFYRLNLAAIVAPLNVPLVPACVLTFASEV